MPENNFAIPGLMEMQSPSSDAQQPWVRLAVHSLRSLYWQGVVAIGPVLINNEPPGSAAASATMKFSPKPDGEVVSFTCSTDPGVGTIMIENANLWQFTVPPQEIPLEIGLWYWWFVVTDVEEGTTLTYRGTLLIQP